MAGGLRRESLYPVVQGYKSSADAGLAVTRGEMDALYVPESSANHFVKSKQNWALATISRTKSRFFEHRPTIFEAAKMDADQTWVMDFLGSVEALGRAYARVIERFGRIASEQEKRSHISAKKSR